jgi:NAD(P)-dependent dehydrogenase (short-subunit alcohol dehydrogenase family)
MLADLSSQAQVRQLAQEFKSKYSRLDVLVNNAGGVFPARKQNVDGFEMTFALDHLNYFLLTNLLLDTIKASAPARIVNVASEAHRRVPGINVATDFWFADTRLRHNGGVLKTLAMQLTQLVMISPEQGAQTGIYLATSPEVEGMTSKYFVNKKEVPSSIASQDQEVGQRLWHISETLTGLSRQKELPLLQKTLLEPPVRQP